VNKKERIQTIWLIIFWLDAVIIPGIGMTPACVRIWNALKTLDSTPYAWENFHGARVNRKKANTIFTPEIRFDSGHIKALLTVQPEYFISATYGAEQLRYGIYDHDGEEIYRSHGIRQISEELGRIGDLFCYSRLNNQVAILNDYHNICADKTECFVQNDNREIFVALTEKIKLFNK